MRRLLSGSRRSDAKAPAPARADDAPGESLEDLYKEFCATFCFKPGTNLMQYLKDNGYTDLIKWLHWDTNEPEPKGLIRLFVSSTREGYRSWEQSGITLVHDGGWDITGGGPSQSTQKALSELAKILEKKILVGYKEKPGGTWMKMDFEP